MNQLKKQLDHALSSLHTDGELAGRVQKLAGHRPRSRNSFRKLAIAACLVLVCSAVICASAMGGFQVFQTAPETGEVSRYQATFQPEPVTLSPEAEERLEAMVQAGQRGTRYDSLAEVEELLGISLPQSNLLALRPDDHITTYDEDGNRLPGGIWLYIGGGKEFEGYQIIVSAQWDYCYTPGEGESLPDGLSANRRLISYADGSSQFGYPVPVRTCTELYTYPEPAEHTTSFSYLDENLDEADDIRAAMEDIRISEYVAPSSGLSATLAESTGCNAFFAQDGLYTTLLVDAPEGIDSRMIAESILDSIP